MAYSYGGPRIDAFTTPGRTELSLSGDTFNRIGRRTDQDAYRRALDLYGQQQMASTQGGIQAENARYQAQLQSQLQRSGAYTGLMQTAGTASTRAQIAEALARYQPAYQAQLTRTQQGNLTDAEEQGILANTFSDVRRTAAAQQGNINAGLAARGAGADPVAASALGLQGLFAAQGARGNVRAGLATSEGEARAQGSRDLAGTAGAMGSLSTQATQEGIRDFANANLGGTVGSGLSYNYGGAQGTGQQRPWYAR
jgi:hypothetical protein